MKKRAFVSFSGGKDSTLALHKARENGFEPVVLLNMLNGGNGRSMSHAIPGEVLEAQAQALGLPLKRVPTSWGAYEGDFLRSIAQLKQEYAIEAGVFGDIDIEAHLEWERNICQKCGVEAHLPLWGMKREDVVEMFLSEGFSSLIIVADTRKMPQSYLGRTFNRETVRDLTRDGIDTCGENGEFHTLALDGPCFVRPLAIKAVGQVFIENRCFLQIERM